MSPNEEARPRIMSGDLEIFNSPSIYQQLMLMKNQSGCRQNSAESDSLESISTASVTTTHDSASITSSSGAISTRTQLPSSFGVGCGGGLIDSPNTTNEELSSIHSSEGRKSSLGYESLGYESLCGYEIAAQLSTSASGGQLSAVSGVESAPITPDLAFPAAVAGAIPSLNFSSVLDCGVPLHPRDELGAFCPPPEYPGASALSPAAAAAMVMAATSSAATISSNCVSSSAPSASSMRRSYEVLSPHGGPATVRHSGAVVAGPCMASSVAAARGMPVTNSHPELARMRVAAAEAAMAMPSLHQQQNQQQQQQQSSLGRRIFPWKRNTASPAQSLDRTSQPRGTTISASVPSPTQRVPQLSQPTVAAPLVDGLTDRLTTLVECLTTENQILKSELDGQRRKVTRVQLLEQELQKVQEAHEELVKTSLKREGMEKGMRLRQEAHIRNLGEDKHKLQEKVKALSTRVLDCSSPAVSSSSLAPVNGLTQQMRKESYVHVLVQQNEELQAATESLSQSLSHCNERADRERARAEGLLAERERLVAELDSTKNALAVKEHECQHRDQQTRRLEEIQLAFNSLLMDTEKREARERQYHRGLEAEVRALRSGTSIPATSSPSRSPSASVSNPILFPAGFAMGGDGSGTGATAARTAQLEEQVSTQEETIRQYQREALKWEEKYLQELSQYCGPNTGSTCQSTSENNAAELAAQVNTLSSRLAEREAVIVTLQKRCYAAASAANNSISSAGSRNTPIHSPALSRTSIDEQYCSPAHFTDRKSSLRSLRSVRSGAVTPITSPLTVSSTDGEEKVELQMWRV